MTTTQPVSSGWPQHSKDISLVEAQLSRACGQMVAQCLYFAGKTTNGGQRDPTQSQPQPPILLSPRAHHGGLEGRAGECGSCRLSLGSGSRRTPTVCATSWNTDLSRLSQSDGSLGDGSRGSVCALARIRLPYSLCLYHGLPLTCLWAGLPAEAFGTQRGIPT